MANETNKYTLDSVVRGCVTIGVIGLIYLMLWELSGVLLPFIISWLIAYMLSPLTAWLQNKCRIRNRGLAVGCTILIVICFISSFFLLIIPPMVEQIVSLKGYVATYLSDMRYLAFVPDQLEDDVREWVSNVRIQDLIQSDDAKMALREITPKIWGWVSGGLSALSGVAIFFVCCLYVIFILLDYEELSTRWVNYVPTRYRAVTQQLASDMSEGMNGYFRGQALVATIVGVLFAVGFTIIGLPMGIAMGIFIGVLNMVPYLQTLAVFPCLLLGLIQAAQTGRPFWLIVLSLLLIFILVQGTQDLFLTPKIMGKAMGLHPAIILLSLSVWGSLLGVLGLIIALPLTTLMLSYYRHYVVESRESKE